MWPTRPTPRGRLRRLQSQVRSRGLDLSGSIGPTLFQRTTWPALLRRWAWPKVRSQGWAHGWRLNFSGAPSSAHLRTQKHSRFRRNRARDESPLLIRLCNESGAGFKEIVSILPHSFIQPISFVDNVILAPLVEVSHPVQTFHGPLIFTPLVNLRFRRGA